jgi:hypothetical protein
MRGAIARLVIAGVMAGFFIGCLNVRLFTDLESTSFDMGVDWTGLILAAAAVYLNWGRVRTLVSGLNPQ